MSIYNAELHCMMSSPAAKTPGAMTPMPAPSSSGDGEGFFHHLWNVINPLQHLPVVGTIYRAVTGEHIGSIEKIAGDTLYGGLWGGITSVADVAFESITGKSAEDTVLAWFKPEDAGVGVAGARVQPRMAVNAPLPSANMPSLPTDIADASQPRGLELAALTRSLSARGVDSDTAARALYAYRRMMTPQPVPVVASLN